MIPFGCEALLPARILRRRKRAANVATDDSAVFTQSPERPFKVCNCEPPILPICHCIIRAQTIEVDRHVNISVTDIRNEQVEMFPPIVLQDRTATLSVFHRVIIRPRMNFKPACVFTGAIGKNVMRPPALEISAAPDRDVLDLRELKRAIDPSAASPFGRTHIPVRMIVERNQNEGFTQPTKPKRTEIMEIARAVENEWRDLASEFAVEFLD